MAQNTPYRGARINDGLAGTYRRTCGSAGACRLRSQQVQDLFRPARDPGRRQQGRAADAAAQRQHGAEGLSHRAGQRALGHKQFEGDGKTPEGLYYIDRRNPDSRYHLSIGISYPNPHDAVLASELGRSAGSDIFIHGQGPEGRALSRLRQDWTAGCIAVTDAEVEDIYAMVRDGTPIMITP